MKKPAVISILALIFAVASLIGLFRFRVEQTLEYDKGYWPEEKIHRGNWIWAKTPAGIIYNLYLPDGMDQDSAEKKQVPLIVCFHGSTGKHTAKDLLGRLFTENKIQRRFGSNGVAVLIPQSRVEYFSDPHAYTRLIENIIIQFPSIDSNRIAGYGFSQGAAFVHELAAYSPFLFRAAITGSSYYSMRPIELIRSARVSFYCALSRNDQGIYKQGVRTAQILSIICPHSRYHEYEKRGHFYVEPGDSTNRGKETVLEWLVESLK